MPALVTMMRVDKKRKVCLQVDVVSGATPAWRQGGFAKGTCASVGHGDAMFNAAASNVFMNTK